MTIGWETIRSPLERCLARGNPTIVRLLKGQMICENIQVILIVRSNLNSELPIYIFRRSTTGAAHFTEIYSKILKKSTTCPFANWLADSTGAADTSSSRKSLAIANCWTVRTWIVIIWWARHHPSSKNAYRRYQQQQRRRQHQPQQ